MGYFFWLKDNIKTTKVAKAIANIRLSATDTGTTPFQEVSQPPLSTYTITTLSYHFQHNNTWVKWLIYSRTLSLGTFS